MPPPFSLDGLMEHLASAVSRGAAAAAAAAYGMFDCLSPLTAPRAGHIFCYSSTFGRSHLLRRRRFLGHLPKKGASQQTNHSRPTDGQGSCRTMYGRRGFVSRHLRRTYVHLSRGYFRGLIENKTKGELTKRTLSFSFR